MERKNMILLKRFIPSHTNFLSMIVFLLWKTVKNRRIQTKKDINYNIKYTPS